MANWIARRAAWALLVCLGLFTAQWLPAAEAHAELVSAYPAPGTMLDATPAEIRLTFSERVGAGSHIQLFGPQFRAVTGVKSGPDPAAPEQIRAFPPQLQPDTYTVEWTAISLDGHLVSGSYAFAISAPAAAPATSVSRWPAAWQLIAGLAAALGLGGVAWTLARRQHLRRGTATREPRC